MQNIFNRLGMDATAFLEYGTVRELKLDEKYKNLALGYEFDVTVAKPVINEVKRYLPMQVPGPAGAMISNISDLLFWNNALYAGHVIPKNLLDLMLGSTISTGAVDGSYAYGIECKNSAISW